MTNESNDDLGLPSRFRPEWPPKPSGKPLDKVFARCSEKFKKVEWPPKEEERPKSTEPVTTIPLLDQMPMNDERMKPVDTYKWAPCPYAEQPAQLNEDVWPPPEPLDLSERVIYDASRPKRAIRDYTVFFSKNKGPEAGKSYKVPPGTLHVVAERGVLSFDNVDIGRGTLAEQDKEKKKQEEAAAAKRHQEILQQQQQQHPPPPQQPKQQQPQPPRPHPQQQPPRPQPQQQMRAPPRAPQQPPPQEESEEEEYTEEEEEEEEDL